MSLKHETRNNCFKYQPFSGAALLDSLDDSAP